MAMLYIELLKSGHSDLCAAVHVLQWKPGEDAYQVASRSAGQNLRFIHRREFTLQDIGHMVGPRGVRVAVRCSKLATAIFTPPCMCPRGGPGVMPTKFYRDLQDRCCAAKCTARYLEAATLIKLASASSNRKKQTVISASIKKLTNTFSLS